MTATQRALLRTINWYQRAAEGRPSPCRFFPTCSSYADEAIHVHGTWRGLALTIRRLLRCRPFGPTGFDPVPLPHDSSALGDADRPTRAASTPQAAGRAEKGC